MERIIKDFRIANNLSLMETVRETPFHAGYCPAMELGICDLSRESCSAATHSTSPRRALSGEQT